MLRYLRDTGLSLEAIADLHIQDARVDEDAYLIRSPEGEIIRVGPVEVVSKYLQRRADLSPDCSPGAVLICDLSGNPVRTSKLEEHLTHARTLRSALEAVP